MIIDENEPFILVRYRTSDKKFLSLNSNKVSSKEAIRMLLAAAEDVNERGLCYDNVKYAITEDTATGPSGGG